MWMWGVMALDAAFHIVMGDDDHADAGRGKHASMSARALTGPAAVLQSVFMLHVGT